MNKKVVYIASAYSIGDAGENVAIQMDAAHRIMDLGHAPIAPLLSHFLHIHRQRPYEDWLLTDEAFVAKSDVLFRIPGESKGADKEVEWADKYGVPVVYSWEELERLLLSWPVQHSPCQ